MLNPGCVSLLLARSRRLMERNEQFILDGRVKLGTLGQSRLFFMVLAALFFSLPSSAREQVQAGLAGKNILVLHAFEANMPINVKTEQGLMAMLETGGLDVKQQFFEYLDLARNPGPEHRKNLTERMRLRYGQRKIDLIVTLYAEPLQLVLHEASSLFPNVPILALYLSGSTKEINGS